MLTTTEVKAKSDSEVTSQIGPANMTEVPTNVAKIRKTNASSCISNSRSSGNNNSDTLKQTSAMATKTVVRSKTKAPRWRCAMLLINADKNKNNNINYKNNNSYHRQQAVAASSSLPSSTASRVAVRFSRTPFLSTSSSSLPSSSWLYYLGLWIAISLLVFVQCVPSPSSALTASLTGSSSGNSASSSAMQSPQKRGKCTYSS
ncbi:uncharacterized protein LOC120772707 [Bactrocera tryoni]|uniref:uncharacterized protein LOC120772707 n=1 Tax=Bactrocera tryoni TaxID=59916 RepID=UPI001A95AFF8|nr:uncharacterized protein LOC120772707 [Bactrocera tryoni]